jgi:hypothetical protein
MSSEHSELDDLQAAYKSAVETWITSIRREEALASAANHSVTEIDRFEQAHFDEEKMRNTAKEAKKKYEDGLRTKFFGF